MAEGESTNGGERESLMSTNGSERQSIMEASDTAFEYTCTPCEEDNKYTEAHHYCANCGRQFCDLCLQMHNHIFKKHTIQGRDQVSMWSSIGGSLNSSLYCPSMTSLNSNLSITTQDSRHMCSLHAAEIQSYCRDHDQVCCTVCVATKHRYCKRVGHIQDAAIGFLQSRSTHDLQEQLETLMARLKRLTSRRIKNKEELKETYSETMLKIDSLRQHLNQILDELEKQTTEERNRLMKSLDSTLQSHIDSCSNLHEEMVFMLNNMDEKTKQTNDTYAFVCHKRCREKIQEADSLLNTFLDQDYDMQFTPHEEIEATLTKFTALGEFKVVPPLTARPVHPPSMRSQMSTENLQITKYNIKLSMENQGEISTNAMVILATGNMVLIDNINNNMKLLNENKNVIAQRRLLSPPHDMCAVSDTRVAVTFSESWLKKEIIFFDTVTGKIEQNERIKMKHSCYGIAFYDNKLYVSSHSTIYVHDLDGSNQEVLYENKDKRYPIFRFALSEDGKNFYITSNKSNLLMTVGRSVSNFKDPELKFPSGVCRASDGTVLVCGWESQAVFQVDGEGRQKLATVARQAEGVRSPWCLAYDENSAQLLIGGHSDYILAISMK